MDPDPYLVLMDLDPDPYLVLMDPDPGGPKTYESRSAKLFVNDVRKKSRSNGFDLSIQNQTGAHRIIFHHRLIKSTHSTSPVYVF